MSVYNIPVLRVFLGFFQRIKWSRELIIYHIWYIFLRLYLCQWLNAWNHFHLQGVFWFTGILVLGSVFLLKKYMDTQAEIIITWLDTLHLVPKLSFFCLWAFGVSPLFRITTPQSLSLSFTSGLYFNPNLSNSFHYWFFYSLPSLLILVSFFEQQADYEWLLLPLQPLI